MNQPDEDEETTEVEVVSGKCANFPICFHASPLNMVLHHTMHHPPVIFTHGFYAKSCTACATTATAATPATY